MFVSRQAPLSRHRCLSQNLHFLSILVWSSLATIMLVLCTLINLAILPEQLKVIIKLFLLIFWSMLLIAKCLTIKLIQVQVIFALTTLLIDRLSQIIFLSFTTGTSLLTSPYYFLLLLCLLSTRACLYMVLASSKIVLLAKLLDNQSYNGLLMCVSFVRRVDFY